MMTGSPGVFAGGDMVPSERTVTVGVGHGKKAARFIDAYLSGGLALSRPEGDQATFDRLHPWYFADAERRQPARARARPAGRDFTEVVGGLTDGQAHYEAARCLSCGNCFECDGCFGSCPEDAIIKIRPSRPGATSTGRTTPTNSTMTGAPAAGSVTAQCPVHAIEMIPE